MMNKAAKDLIEALRRRSWTAATAESLTGGGIGQCLTSVPGSSAVYCGGVITYTNAVKEALLGVPHDILDSKGAVSPETAEAMARGVCTLLHADLGIAVTGIAGPGSDERGNPVGLVYIGLCSHGRVIVARSLFSGSREEIRQQTIAKALKLAAQML